MWCPMKRLTLGWKNIRPTMPRPLSTLTIAEILMLIKFWSLDKIFNQGMEDLQIDGNLLAMAAKKDFLDADFPKARSFHWRKFWGKVEEVKLAGVDEAALQTAGTEVPIAQAIVVQDTNPTTAEVLAKPTRSTSRLTEQQDSVVNFNPIFGLSDEPETTLHDALSIMSEAPQYASSFKHLKTSADAAYMFANNFLIEKKDEEKYKDLSREHIAAINFFTHETPFYPALNKCLRSRDRTDIKPFFRWMKLALSGLYKLSLELQTVYRGVKLDLQASYPRGRTFVNWSFTSTTRNLEVLQTEQFLGSSGDRTLFSIKAYNLVAIKDLSSIPSEDEVLMLPGTVLKVTGVLQAGNGLTMIQLEQDTNATALLDFVHPMLTAKMSDSAASRSDDVIGTTPEQQDKEAEHQAEIEALKAAAEASAKAAADATAQLEAAQEANRQLKQKELLARSRFQVNVNLLEGEGYGIGIRKGPEYPGQRIGTSVVHGQTVWVTQEIEITVVHNHITYKRMFYKLEDGRGWIHDFDPDAPERRTLYRSNTTTQHNPDNSTGRPSIGDSVKVKSGSYKVGCVGVIFVDEHDSQPYKLKFHGNEDSHWFRESEIEMVPSLVTNVAPNEPPPEYDVKIDLLEGPEAGIGIRSNPKYPGERTGRTVQHGEVCRITQKKTFSHTFGGKMYTTCFYKLKDNRGWIHDFDPDCPPRRTMYKTEGEFITKVDLLEGEGAAIGIRAGPEYPGLSVGSTVLHHELNWVTEVQTFEHSFKGVNYKTFFYKLKDGRGWIHDFDPDAPSRRTLSRVEPMATSGSRPTIGDIVTIVNSGAGFENGEVGKVYVDEKDSQPYKLIMRGVKNQHWFRESEVRRYVPRVSVGDVVKVVHGSHRNGSTGTIYRDDRGERPYFICFDGIRDQHSFRESEVSCYP